VPVHDKHIYKIIKNNMDNNIEKIGILKYIWTITTGENKQFYKWEDIEGKDLFKNKSEEEKQFARNCMPDKDMERGIINGDIVATIAKNAVIITISASWQYNGQRVPIIIKRWEKNKENNNPENLYFIDTDNNKWKYDKIKNKLTCKDCKGKLLYRFT
jgi:hypothetical protein